jgi:outer membrane lipoprotein-sorting protein
MRKFTRAAAVVIVLGLSLLLAACGAKDAADIVKDLEQKRAKLDSYKGSVTMTFHTGQEPMKYDVEVWYKKENFYRIALTNKQKDVTQIVLRNKDGVFVLTPHLKKSFRFQSDWPDNQGEIYLYQTLLDGILEDESRQFAEDKEAGAYVFKTAGNYKNHSFASQKIWLSRNDYAPKRVEISDEAGNLLVELDFKDFKFGAQFEAQDFDMQHNLTMHSVTTAAAPGDVDAQPEPASVSFGVIEPAYVPLDVALISQPAELDLGEARGVMLRYGGAYNYVLVESRPLAQTVSYAAGEVVDLGFGIGVLTGEEQRTLHWMLDGVEYRLMSGDLPKEEMVRIAQSVQGQIGK